MLPDPGADPDGRTAARSPAEGSATGCVLLVDAANVVGSRPDGWWRDRPAAARRLLSALRPLVGLPGALPDGRTAHTVVVVLEGRARDGAAPGSTDGVAVVHAEASGDDTLADLCAPGVLLATSDRGLAARARAAGATVVGAGHLRDLLDALDDPGHQDGRRRSTDQPRPE